MANLKSFYYPAMVIEKQAIRELEGGKAVLNLIVERTEELIEGFKEKVEKRIVLFNRKAREADTHIGLGDCVIFSKCRKSAREFTTEKQNQVQTVDILAENFQVEITKAKFLKISESLMAMNAIPTSSELEFTDEDAAAIAKKAALGITGTNVTPDI